MELIDKAAVIAEIKRRIDLLKSNESGVFHAFASEMIIIEYENMLPFIDTLEVKGEFKQHCETNCPNFDEAQGTPITK